MPESSSSRSGFMPTRVVHLHASKFCNLACQHCYSASGPDIRHHLPPEEIIAALDVLKTEGYDVLSLSGGEPLLYSGFETLVRGASEMGFRISLITNGAPVRKNTLDVIAKYVNLVAVSLDGSPDTHIELRGNKQAFVYVEKALANLKLIGINYGLAYCVSRESIGAMPWAVDYAKEMGAHLVQFHPFAATGRGKQLENRLGLSRSDRTRAYLIANLLDMEDNLSIHIDLAPNEIARMRRGDYRILSLEDANNVLLSELISPLIIDERGFVYPFSYGISHHFALGRIGDGFRESIAWYKETSWSNLRDLINDSFGLLDTSEKSVVDWFYHIVETSHGSKWTSA